MNKEFQISTDQKVSGLNPDAVTLTPTLKSRFFYTLY
jgi:hypothetical protein